MVGPEAVQSIRSRTASQRGPWSISSLRNVFPAEH
jgi:hypothetical protein